MILINYSRKCTFGDNLTLLSEGLNFISKNFHFQLESHSPNNTVYILCGSKKLLEMAGGKNGITEPSKS